MRVNTNYLFLLGGWDLEMNEIQKLLIEKELCFLDAGLDWSNAQWKAYLKGDYYKKIEEALLVGHKIFGIELQGNMPDPENFYLIDHHNESQDKPASLEQLATLLDVQLDRWQQLVAANDKGYIPAMEAMGASREEIQKVRRADRKMQGVTEEQEQLALESIERHTEIVDGLYVVRSLTEKFSPIPDLLYGKSKSLLIYNHNTLNYYGKGKEVVSHAHRALIEEGKAYEGGGKRGYFGLAKGCYSEKEILFYKDAITRLII